MNSPLNPNTDHKSPVGYRLRVAMSAIALVLLVVMLIAPAHAERVKDIGQFQGLRANQLTGYGIVVGLA